MNMIKYLYHHWVCLVYKMSNCLQHSNLNFEASVSFSIYLSSKMRSETCGWSSYGMAYTGKDPGKRWLLTAIVHQCLVTVSALALTRGSWKVGIYTLTNYKKLLGLARPILFVTHGKALCSLLRCLMNTKHLWNCSSTKFFFLIWLSQEYLISNYRIFFQGMLYHAKFKCPVEMEAEPLSCL